MIIVAKVYFPMMLISNASVRSVKHCRTNVIFNWNELNKITVVVVHIEHTVGQVCVCVCVCADDDF